MVEYRQVRYQLPSGATELLLVRHGESEPARPDEPFPLVDGHGDPALAEQGRIQAGKVADRLANERVDAIFVTPLRRTAQTAAPLAARLGITPEVSAGLREVYLGEWEGGLFRQRVAENHPIAIRMRALQRWDVIPGGEPTEKLSVRIRHDIEQIAAAHPDQRVAIFTHGGVISQIIADATGSGSFAFAGADNGSISTVVVTEHGWVVRGFNDVSHLGRAESD
ncbi:MAG TPA: histidine phosphatase family protein [Pseudonocardiaceae bacterium]|nr:histidine phosphatase family protein [Pseudonocardiaceae bacterium]